MSLSNNQKRHLRGLAHAIKPVVMLGQKGLTETVMEEVRIALDVHELIKIRVSTADREERKRTLERICSTTEAELVQAIGNIGVLFKRNPDKPKVEVPRA